MESWVYVLREGLLHCKDRHFTTGRIVKCMLPQRRKGAQGGYRGRDAMLYCQPIVYPKPL